MSQNEKKVSSTKQFPEKKKEDKYKKRQNNMMIGTVIILIITVISFVLVPALAGGASKGANFTFGKYGNKVIKFSDGNYFAQQVESINNMYRDSLGADSNMSFLRQLIWRSAFNKTVVRTAVLEELNESGANVSDKAVDRGIVTSGAFNNEAGKFDEQAYLNASATRLKSLRESVKEDALLQLFYGDAVYGVRRSNQMMDYLLDLGSPEKKFAYAKFPYSSYPDSEVKNYGEEHAKMFQKLKLKRISVGNSEKEGAEILKKLESGESSFEDLAKNYSKDSFASEGGVMPEAYYYTFLSYLTEDQATKLSGLKAKDHTGVITTDKGLYIFEAISNVAQADFTSPATIASVKTYMEQEEIGLIEDYLVGQAETLVLASKMTDFTTAATAANAETGETGFVAPAFGNIAFVPRSPAAQRNDTLMNAAAYSDDFFNKAFALKNPKDMTEPLIIDRSVVVFSLLETQDGFEYPEEYQGYVDRQINNELSKYNENQVQDLILKSDKLKNNFNEAYNSLFKQS